VLSIYEEMMEKDKFKRKEKRSDTIEGTKKPEDE
jgi:hypothetical protein